MPSSVEGSGRCARHARGGAQELLVSRFNLCCASCLGPMFGVRAAIIAGEEALHTSWSTVVCEHQPGKNKKRPVVVTRHAAFITQAHVATHAKWRSGLAYRVQTSKRRTHRFDVVSSRLNGLSPPIQLVGLRVDISSYLWLVRWGGPTTVPPQGGDFMLHGPVPSTNAVASVLGS